MPRDVSSYRGQRATSTFTNVQSGRVTQDVVRQPPLQYYQPIPFFRLTMDWQLLVAPQAGDALIQNLSFNNTGSQISAVNVAQSTAETAPSETNLFMEVPVGTVRTFFDTREPYVLTQGAGLWVRTTTSNAALFAFGAYQEILGASNA